MTNPFKGLCFSSIHFESLIIFDAKWRDSGAWKLLENISNKNIKYSIICMQISLTITTIPPFARRYVSRSLNIFRWKSNICQKPKSDRKPFKGTKTITTTTTTMTTTRNNDTEKNPPERPPRMLSFCFSSRIFIKLRNDDRNRIADRKRIERHHVEHEMTLAGSHWMRRWRVDRCSYGGSPSDLRALEWNALVQTRGQSHRNEM